MTERILCVDDDPNVLSAFERHLRRRFDISTARSGNDGLEALATGGPYAVIVSDLRMPLMDGIQFLARARDHAPDTVRILLTGDADITAAIEAVNEGNVFRFLTKPCPPEMLAKALEAGVRQYRLVAAEHELLEQTLRGSVKVLTDVLSVVNPSAFGRASRVRRTMSQLAAFLNVEQPWEFELAGMLSQIGCVTLPEAVLEKTCSNQPLSQVELEMYQEHPRVGHDLIANIPRLKGIARIILYQGKHYNGLGMPPDDRAEQDIPLGARALHAALDYDTLVSAGNKPARALAMMKERVGWYDPRVLEALQGVVGNQVGYALRSVALHELEPKMILAEHLKTLKGVVLMSRGQEVSASMKARLENFERTAGVRQPIRVLVPVTRSEPPQFQVPIPRDP